MIVEYKLETDKKIEFQDEFGMHIFKTEEEYEKYIYERNSKLPNVCDTCIYGCQANRKKYSCPFDGPHGKDNPCRACSNYWRNPSGLKDWLKWHKHKFLNKYYSWVDRIQRKFKIGFFKTYRKAFWFWPTFKHPYFEFVRRLRNEYEDECNVYRLGWISKKNSYYKSSSFFEKFHTIGYVFCREHINYQQAECINDCYINTFNNIESGDSYFICHKEGLYKVRHVAKYNYYDVLYNVRDEDEYNLRLKGQISEEEFNKYFKIPNHEELMLNLEEINRKKQQT